MLRLTRNGPRAHGAARLLVLTTCAGAAVLVGLPFGGELVTGSAGGKTPVRHVPGACPNEARPLPPDALAGATRAALREAPRLYGGPQGIDTRGRRATRAALAEVAGVRGRQVARDCGPVIQRKTVVVDLEFPRLLPSASLSQGTAFVSRQGRSYRVWKVAH